MRTRSKLLYRSTITRSRVMPCDLWMVMALKGVSISASTHASTNMQTEFSRSSRSMDIPSSNQRDLRPPEQTIRLLAPQLRKLALRNDRPRDAVVECHDRPLLDLLWGTSVSVAMMGGECEVHLPPSQ